MPIRCHLIFCLVLAVAAASWQHEAAATEPVHPAPASTAVQPLHRRLKASIGYHFNSGDYGDDDTTTINYVPLVITAEISRFTFQTTIPYLSISGPPGVRNGPAGPIATDGEGDGLGDLFARAAYLLPWKSTWPMWVPFVDIGGLVKFPTASRGDGLGTGEFDFGIESDLTWGLGRLTPFALVGYRFLGEPPDTNLRDFVVSSVGGVYRILDTLSAGLLLDYRQASSSSTGERVEIVPFGSWKFIRPWSIDLYVSAGLAKGSPDAGVGTQLGYTW